MSSHPASPPQSNKPPSKETAQVYVALAFGVFLAVLVNTNSLILAAAAALLVAFILFGMMFGTFGRWWLASFPYRVALMGLITRTAKGDAPVIIPFLSFPLGYNTRTGKDVVHTLEELGNILIVGINGSGKTSLVHNFIHSAIQHPKDMLRLVILDQKDGLDFRIYRRIHNLLYPVTENVHQSEIILAELVKEKTRRATVYKAMPPNKMCGNMTEYHALRTSLMKNPPPGFDPNNFPVLPWILVVIDEFHLLKQTDTGFALVQELIKTGRAYGIRIIDVTQYPKADDIPTDITSQHHTKLVGWMMDKGDYYKVAQVTKEWYEGLPKVVGRFIANVNGEMFYLTSNFVGRDELERMAERCSVGYEPAMPSSDVPISAPNTRIKWTGDGLTAQQKAVLLRNFILELGHQPTQEEFLARFDASVRTYSNHVPSAYLALVREGAIKLQE